MIKRYQLLLLLGMSVTARAQEWSNLIRNPEFDNSTRYWYLVTGGNAEAQMEPVSGAGLSGDNALRLTVTQGGDSFEDVQLQTPCRVELGQIYRISFLARADVECGAMLRLHQRSDQSVVFWSSPELTVGPGTRRFGPFEFKSRQEETSSRITWFLGGSAPCTFFLDSVMVEITRDSSYVFIEEKFEKRVFACGETTLPVRLCRPDFFDPQLRYPLVLALHGAGERGTDNESHIAVHRMATAWADSANQKRFPCYVVAPQCPEENRWVDADWSTGTYRMDEVPISNEMTAVDKLLDALIAEFPIDTSRLYITGLSMGGLGTWDMICRFPDRFAAAVPMSGMGDSSSVDRIAHLPIWVFHGEKDSTVPVRGSRFMIQALENAGRHTIYTHCQFGDCSGMSETQIDSAIGAGASLLYTEYPNKAHVIWAESYDMPQLLPWVFSQSRKGAAAVRGASVNKPEGFELGQNYPNPFNSGTTIPFHLAEAGRVRIEVFDITGRRVALLLDRRCGAGAGSVRFERSDLPSGSYIVRLQADGAVRCAKMILLR